MNAPGLVVAGVAASLSMTAPAAVAQERSLDDIRKEVMRRAGHINPFEGIRRDDAQRIVDSLQSLDPDHWAALWCKVGLDYEAKGDRRAREGVAANELAELYTLAFEYCHIGRYPVPSTSGKLESYRHSLQLFRKAAAYFQPPLQMVELTFEGKTLIGYLQLPQGQSKPPVV